MTRDDMDRCIGSVVRRLQEERQLLACFRTKAEAAAQALDMVSAVLRGAAHGDFVDGTFYQRAAPDKTRAPMAEAVWQEADSLEALIRDIREAEREIAALEKRRGELGV